MSFQAQEQRDPQLGSSPEKDIKDRRRSTERWSANMRALNAAVWRTMRSPVVLIILLPVLMFGRALRPGRVFSAADNLFLFYPWHALDPGLVPQNSLLGDRTFQFEPWLIYASREIRSERFPLWNPHAFAGAPLLGNAQSAFLFPFTALAYVLPAHTALGVEAILKIMTAGLSMYWMLRVLALQPLAATAGAVAFMFDGFFIVWLGWPQTNVGIWLPLLVGQTERLRQTGAWRHAGWLALVTGVQFLGGHPETSFHILFATGCYALYRLRGPAAKHFLVQFGTAGVLGALLAAVQLLPLFAYLSQSSDLFYRKQGIYISAQPLRAAIVVLIPNYFGNPASRNFWGPGNYNEISGSVGLLPWILAPCALFGGWTRKGTKLFLGLALFAGAAAYSVRPMPRVLSMLPGFSMAANGRLLLVLAFSMAALCGIGMEILITPPPKTQSRIIFGVKVFSLLMLAVSVAYLIEDHEEILKEGLTIFIAFQWGAFFLLLIAGTLVTIYALRRGACNRTLGSCLLAVELLSLLPFAPSYNPVINTKQFYPLTPALEQLRRDHSLFRVLLPIPNVGAVYGLSDIQGYDALTPRHVEQLADTTDSVGVYGNGGLRFTDDLDSQITDLVNLKYLLLPPGAPSPGPKFRLVYDGPDGRVYQNTKVFPRAFLVPHARTCLSDATALDLIRGGNINLQDEVVIAGCPHIASGWPLHATPVVEHYGPERVVVHADVQSPAFLVLTDTYDAGWRVWVDGREASLLRADYAFRAVALGPGSHTVKFRYRPPMFRLGLVLSIIALLGTIRLVSLDGTDKIPADTWPASQPAQRNSLTDE